MVLTPFPSQISGALFLADRQNALLADAPRVGKTGAAIMACDLNLEKSILVVTTASGRAVWRKAWADWSSMGRSVGVFVHGLPDTMVVIVGWPQIANPKCRALLLRRRWDRLILDEAHNAKNFEAKRTCAVYGTPEDDGFIMMKRGALADGVPTWALTGTPIPNSPADLYPMMRALCPDRLVADETKGWPDVMTQRRFMDRYCIIKLKKISNFRKIPVVIGGRNEAELAARLDGFFLRRTQADVGIRAPIHDLMPMTISDAQRRELERDLDKAAIMKAAHEGNTKTLDMHMGPIRRLTGVIKADAVIRAVIDEFDGGLDRIVLAYWHKDVGDALAAGLARFGVARLDGASTTAQRDLAQADFKSSARVFLAQIAAAGEAIDLSASAVLWFVETTFQPAQMAQMSLRITNHLQARQAFVRVCVFENSIDEALQSSLLRKWATIREVLKTDA